MTDYARARLNMVNTQLETNGITSEALLDAYRNTPRELFVDAPLKARAYLDEDQIAPDGTFVMEPMVEALLLQHALHGGEQWGQEGIDTALYLGAHALTGAAILAQVAQTVYLLEPGESLLQTAQARLHEAGVANIITAGTDCASGLPDHAPFDAIVIPGAITHIPDILLDQLSSGGRLVCVLRPTASDQGRALCVTRLEEDRFSSQIIADVSTPYAPEFAPKTEFSF